MKGKTLKELRALAKARGIRGYSKLTKEALSQALAQKNSEHTAAPTKTSAAAPKPANSKRRRAQTAGPENSTGRAQAQAAAPSAAPGSDTGVPAPAMGATPAAHYASAEELVEGVKYALRPNGRTAQPAADLDEDIDRLPPLAEPVVCLLPQKPGILHAYWILPRGETASGDYKLRLCHAANETLEVREEVPVRADTGSWYFHVDEQSSGGLVVQLGYYRDGTFRSARGRSIARLPNLYASSRTDERWWVREEDFMQMYLRAGGFVTPAHRFGWNASVGSPGAAAPPSEQRLAWPGGVSSN